MSNFDKRLQNFIENLDNDSVLKDDNLNELKKRYQEIKKRPDPLSFINISELCYGRKVVEQHLAKNN